MVWLIIAAIVIGLTSWIAYEIKRAPLLDENERPVQSVKQIKYGKRQRPTHLRRVK